MTKIALPPATIVHPHPVLLIGTYGPDGKPNLATVSWGGICSSQPPCIAVSLREATLTYHNILNSRSFTVGFPSRNQVEVADYVGLVSGRDYDKFKVAALTPVKSDKVDAPLATELHYSLECKLVQDHAVGSHRIFIGEILGIQADEEVLGPKGLPDIEKTQAILYGSAGSRHYFAVGEKLDQAFVVGKKMI